MAQRQGKSKVRRRENRFEASRWTPDDGPASHCRLGTWATRNTNLAWSHHQKLAELKIVSVFAEHGIEVAGFTDQVQRLRFSRKASAGVLKPRDFRGVELIAQVRSSMSPAV